MTRTARVSTGSFNSGMIRLAPHVPGEALYDRLVECLVDFDWSGVERIQHDQLVLNRAFEGEWSEIDPSHNYLLRSTRQISRRWDVGIGQARLLHFNVDPRPWEVGRAHLVRDPVLAAATAAWLRAHGAVVAARAIAPDQR